MSDKIVGKRAVVVGGSMAGLLAARVLSSHFAEVIILERDRPPGEPEARAGAPQGRHVHLLLDRGRRIIEALLPGIQDEMIAAGAALLDGARDLWWMSWWGEMVDCDSGPPMLCSSRPFLEHHVRRRVQALPNVRVRSGATVTRLDGTSERVTGVGLQDGEVVAADLVVDAGGRESAVPQWLAALGVAAPRDELVKSYLGYASRWFEPPPTRVWKRAVLIANARPPRLTRGIAIFPAEGGRHVVSLMGINGDHPPTSEPEFLEFVRSLDFPPALEWLAAARPLGSIHGFRFESNRFRHFEECALPRGLIVVGDAVASFNPVYGQGMTTASLGAELLAQALEDGGAPDQLGRRFQRRLAKLMAPVWMQTTTEDLRFPGTEGERKLVQRIMHAYVDRVFVMATRDPSVRRLLTEVLMMTRPSTALFTPGLFVRVLTTAIPPDRTPPQRALTA